MAKEIVLTPVKKGKAEFNLVGRVKINDYTFKMDVESSKSDWVYNQMGLSVDCGKEYGSIFSECMGGYGSERDNKCYVHGKKENENGKVVDDFDNRYEIAWDDRLDDDLLEEVGDMCFITAGIEKDESGKTITRKYLSEYDFIEYLQAHLEDGMVVNVKGNITYSIYNGNVQMKKTIKSIFLSNAEEDKFKATFTQTLLLDSDAVGKLDKEELMIPVEAYIVDYIKEYDGKLAKRMLPLRKTFEVPVSKETSEKVGVLLKHFKAKKKTITMLTVDGIFTKGNVQTKEVTIDDLDEETKELIEAGWLDKDEILAQHAFVNGGGKQKEKMYIKKPHMAVVDNGGNKGLKIDKIDEMYTEDDLNLNLILADVPKSNNSAVDEEQGVDDKEEEQTEDLENEDWMKDFI